MNITQWLRSQSHRPNILRLRFSTLRVSEIGSSVIVNISQRAPGVVAVSLPSGSTVRVVRGRTSTWFYLEPRVVSPVERVNFGVKTAGAKHVGA